MASEPPASDQGRQGVEPSSKTAPTAQRKEHGEGEKQSSTSEAEVDNLRERFREMELKMASMDKLNVFNNSVSEVMDYSSEDPIAAWNRFDPNGSYQEKVDFYADILFFMRKLRTTHQDLVAADRELDRSHEARQTNFLKIDHHRKRFCNDVFMKGEDIRVLELEWEEYLYSPPYIDEDFSAPVGVISGEPDSRTILQMMSTSRPSKGYSPRIERIMKEYEHIESSGQEPLPERIRICSRPLISILTELDRKRGRTTAPAFPNAFIDGSEVHLRPYQELYFREQELRNWLAMLEKRFENYSEVRRPPRVFKRAEGDDVEERESAGDPDQKSSLFQSSQSDQKTEIDSNQKSHDVAVNSSRLTEDHNDDAAEGDTAEGDTAADDTSEGETSEDAAAEDDTFGDKIEMANSRTYRLSHSISALLHLRCLMKFIDKEMKPKQDYISSPKCTRIHFHDLWHLFKPGDEVIQQDSKQAFVVLRVQVPRHRLEEPWNRWNRKSDNRSDSGSDRGQDEDEDNDGPFRLHCVYIDFDGQNFGPVSKRFTISPFGEPKPIKSLPVYPLRYVKDTRKRQELVNRGRMLLDVSKFKAMYYTGITLDNRDEVDSQVVIDFTEALSDETRRKNWQPTIGNLNTAGDRMGSPCSAICCGGRNVIDADTDSKMTEDYMESLFPDTSMGASSLILQPRSSDEVLTSPAKLTETELLIMTYRVFGFVLRSRKWAQLDLGLLRLEDTKARDLTVDAFEGLQLPDNHKELVTSLVVQHFRSKQSAVLKNEQTDLIQGKGKGLILLLHGAPGVGKTTTAEGIAQLFRKPLFQITCGDLGTTAKEVEAELEKNFTLASRWGCILLLDEADVFLSARDKWDFTRNGLVAVFLRVLEYYSGILFLTTNRIGDFDEAFSSRIHMSLDYPALDEEKTLKIFQVNLDLIKKRFVKQGRSITFDISAVMDFARDHFRDHEYNRWNGRQIRNACQTALALAEFDALGSTLDIEGDVDKTIVVELQQKYFKTVQKAYLAFDKYLGDIQGTSGDNRAVDLKFRARTNTTKQNNRNAFTQHEVARSATVQQNLYPEYPHNPRSSSNLSQSTLGLQGDPFDQGYGPATPNANMSQSRGHEQYQSQPTSMQSYEGQSRGGPTAGREIYDRPPEGSQQYPTNHRFSQGGQRGQRFGSPQVSNRIIPSVEDERYPSPSYDDSPRPYRGAQRQSQGYNYDNPDDGGFAQNSTPPTQGPSSYNPDPGFRPRRDDAGN